LESLTIVRSPLFEVIFSIQTGGRLRGPGFWIDRITSNDDGTNGRENVYAALAAFLHGSEHLGPADAHGTRPSMGVSGVRPAMRSAVIRADP